MTRLKTELGRALCGIGVFMILWNITGFFVYKTIENDTPHVYDDHPRTVSEKEFWEQAWRTTGEDLEEYLRRLARLASDRMLRIDPEHTTPTIFENWIVWLYSRYLGKYEWIDSARAARLGGGFCSQHAILFNNILREQGIESRILGLKGHVVNEVLVGGKWKVYDADYDVVFDTSLKDLEDHPEKVEAAYKAAGRPEEEARHWRDVFAASDNHENFRSAMMYSPRRYLVETAALYLIWILPVACIFMGLALGRGAKRRA